MQIEIDGAKLRALLLSRTGGMAEASRVCGFGEGYFSGCASKGKIARYGAAALEREYGIKPEEYACAAKKTEISQTEILPEAREAEAKIDMNELRKAVTLGVVDALMAIIETGKIAEAIRKANQ